MPENIIIILSIIGLIISFVALYKMPKTLQKNFEKQCKNYIRQKDEELEKQEQITRELKKWLFHT